MEEIRNAAQKRLEAGDLALGAGIRHARTVDIAPVMKTCGYDWLFIDLEHNAMSLDTAVQIAVAALDAGIAPIARVPHMQHWLATRFLDGGGLGIVMPHVDSADEARAVVDHLKFPPLGHRSLIAPLAQLGFAGHGIPETIAAINQATLVTVMIESPQAIEEAEAIAAVPGVDVLLIGTNDLAAEMGIPGEVGHPRIEAAYATVAEACRKHGKKLGMGGVYDHEVMQRYIGMGAKFILSGNDLAFLMASATERSRFLRSIDPR